MKIDSAGPIEKVDNKKSKNEKSDKKSKKINSASEDHIKTEKKDKSKNKEEKSDKKSKRSIQDDQVDKKSKKSKTKSNDNSPASSSEISEFLKMNGVRITSIETGKDASLIYPPILSFENSGFDKDLLSSCSSFDKPTPIQSACWDILNKGKDIVGIAETGSGKTFAFALPAIQKIKPMKDTSASVASPYVLVLAPTRELAMQTQEQFDLIKATAKGIESICLYGGVPKYEQKKVLYKSLPKIIVATPGRLIDLVECGDVSLKQVNFLVLDEADRMLDQGFEQVIRKIINSTDPNIEKQMVMFSATWPEEIRSLASEFLKSPIRVNVSGVELVGNGDNPENNEDSNDGKLIINQRVTQIVQVMDPYNKENNLTDLLSKYHKNQSSKIIIFVLYKKEASRVENSLQRKGFNCVSIHGDKSQDLRSQALKSFKSGQVPLLIATDVAARGLDIPNVEYVINYTFPLTIDDYIHRIGRTGRAGKKGISHTFFTVEDKHHSGSLINVLKEAKMDVPDNLLKFGTTVKKKEHKVYGAFFKDIDPNAKPTKIIFD
ncbi:ATP-dependent RNA helicase DBP3 [Smittium culicis]|uniref:RNA helicase n=1 Tax=Smittium culicis TaxID=133412 RepID=A0A1R1YEF0_9FUNG|nr:ATP-dependent RNA helicase DBP3 [Smittium culicis]